MLKKFHSVQTAIHLPAAEIKRPAKRVVKKWGEKVAKEAIVPGGK